MHEHDEWVRSQVLDQERLLKQKGEWWKEWNAAAKAAKDREEEE